MTWYCIRTERRAELSLVADLRALGLTAYVPVETHDRKVRGRKQRISVPAFQGYAFVNCEVEQHADVLACDGAFDFVRYVGGDREPARMPANALRWVLLAELFGDLDYTREPPPWSPARNDVVKVTKGMWKGRIARIISVGKREILLEPLDGVGRWKIGPGSLDLAA